MESSSIKQRNVKIGNRYRPSDAEGNKRVLNRKLLSAVEEDKLEKVKKHLKAGADVNARDASNKNNTPLHYAVEKDNKEIVDWLLQSGAGSTLENSDHKTPLMLARERNIPEIINALESVVPQESRPVSAIDQQSPVLAAQPVEGLQPGQPVSNQQPGVMTATVPPSHHDLQPGSSSNRDTQSILPPFSGKLAVDTNLILSRNNFKQSLEKLVKGKELPITKQLNAVPPYPTPYVLAQFASQAYQDYSPNESDRDYEKRLGLPQGWKLLTTAKNSNTANGYFGAAYWHPELQQVVITHRGTQPTNLGADWADIKGVVFNNYVSQMNSASTFANKISTVLSELNKLPGINFQLFFTGHSLGGWLAQITTFTTKYLHSVETDFLKNHPARAGYHAHTVVFDSPGCKAMLSQMQDSFDVRYGSRSLSLKALDIGSYLSAPNRINTCNTHLGSVYRIFTDLSDMGRIAQGTALYNLEAHNMQKILAVFDPSTGQVGKDAAGKLKLQTVVDWPISGSLRRGDEYKDFFKWAEHLNNYHPETTDESFEQATSQGYYPIRYQTTNFDETVSSLSVFTQSEQQFLERYQWLRGLPEFFKPEDLLAAIGTVANEKRPQEQLRTFETDGDIIRCVSAEALQKLIPYVKRLLQLFPQIKVVTENALSSFEVRSKVYQSESAHYLVEVEKEFLDFKRDTVGLGDFLRDAQQQVWQQVVSGETRVGLTRVYKVFQKIKENTDYANEGSYTTLKLKRLLAINQLVSVKELLIFQDRPHLLMIECKSNDWHQVAEALFKDLFTNVLKEKPKIKVILITQQDDNLSEFFREKAPEALGPNKYIASENKGLSWGELTLVSQQTLLATPVKFQGEDIPLNQLIDTTQTELMEHVSPATLIEKRPLIIGKELPISSGYDEHYYIARTLNHQTAIKQQIIQDRNAQKFSDLLAISDTKEAFNQLCQQHPQRNIHWLKRGSRNLIWQQSQGALSALRDYVGASDTQPTSETELISSENRQKILLISDTPGMGKSTVLTHLSKQIKAATKKVNKALWVARFNLNDYTEQLKKQLTEPNFTSDTAIEFLSKELLELETPLEQALFKHSFQQAGKITLLFDGFDEISPDYKETVLDLLQVLRATSVDKLWVTTRPHMRDALEDKLQQFSYTLEPFSEVNQISFLSKFWQQQLALTHSSPEKQDKLNIYSDRLIKLLAHSISDKEKAFTGIPLQSRLLAETYQDLVKEFYNSNKTTPELPEKLGLMDLYDEFIEKKYAIYKNEKTKNPIGNIPTDEESNVLKDTLRKTYQQLAVKLLFTEEPVNFLRHHEPQRHKNINKILTRIGIAQVTEDKIHFIHRTFAEYYAADFLAQRLVEQNRPEKEESKFLLREILLNSEYQVGRAFLNGHLAKKLSTASTLTEYGTRITELWPNNFQGETFLHVACKEDNAAIIEFLFNSLKSHEKTLKNLVLATSDDKATVLHLVADNGNLKLCEWLLCYVKSNFESTAPGTLKSLVLATNDNGETVLHRAAYRGNLQVCEWLLCYVKANFESTEPGTLKSLVLATNDYGETVLHLAADNGNLELCEWQLGYVKDNVESTAPGTLKRLVLATNDDGETVLHRAAYRGNLELFESLLSYVKANVESTAPGTLKSLVLATRSNKETVLHHAAYRGNLELCEWLLCYVKANFESTAPGTLKSLVLATRINKATVLHLAADNGNLELCEWLLCYVKANVESTAPGTLKSLVLATRINKTTVLHLAADNGNLELCEWLLCYVKANFESTTPGTLKSLVLATRSDKATVLHLGAYCGNLGLCEWLLCYVKANFESTAPGTLKSLVLATNDYGETVLHRAAYRGNLELCEWLLCYVKANFEPTAPGTLKSLVLDTNDDGETVLHLAADNGNLELCEWILGYVKANFKSTEPGTLKSLVLATNVYGETVLHIAACRENLELCEWLLCYVKANFEYTAPGTLKSLVLATNNYGATVLHIAADYGNLELCEWLFGYVKANVESTTPGTLKSLVLATNVYGANVLHVAAYRRNLDLCEWLLCYAKSNFEYTVPGTLKTLVLATNNNGATVLHLAADIGNLKLCEWLLGYAKSNFKSTAPGTLKSLVLANNNNGATILHLAVDNGNLWLCEWLLGYVKSNVESTAPGTLKSLVLATNKYKGTILHLAAYRGNLKLCEWLLHYAKSNFESTVPGTLKRLVLATNNYGATVLHIAADNGNLELCEWLLCYVKANFESTAPGTLKSLVLATNINGATVLHLAAYRRNFDLCEWLLSYAKSNFEYTAPGTLKSLVLATNDIGETVLHRAAYRGNLELCEWLLCYVKANFESTVPGTLKSMVLATNDDGETVLHFAAYRRNLYLCEWILCYAKSNFESTAPGTLKSLVLATNNDGETVLHRAAYRGNLELCKWLLCYVKANFESTAPGTLKSLVLATNKNGSTVLHLAAYRRNLELCEWLLGYVKSNFESTAPGTLKRLVLATNDDGETVLHRAAYRGNLELCEWLLCYLKSNFESTAPGTLKSLVLATNDDGETVLHLAADNGNLELCEWLLCYVKSNFESTAPGMLKSLVLATRSDNATVLRRAAYRRNLHLCEWLLCYAKSNFESTAPGTLKSLVLATNGGGATILHLTVDNRNLELCECLFGYLKSNFESTVPGTLKSLVLATNGGGATILHLTVDNGNLELCECLFGYLKSNFESTVPGMLKSLLLATNDDGETVLHRAAYRGNLELCEWLLGYVKANFESTAPGTLKILVLATNNNGETVLHPTVYRGNLDLCESLLGYVNANVEST